MDGTGTNARDSFHVFGSSSKWKLLLILPPLGKIRLYRDPFSKLFNFYSRKMIMILGHERESNYAITGCGCSGF